MKKVDALREKKPEELNLAEAGLHRELGELRLKHRMGAAISTARLGQIRKEIARILTIRKEKS
ncbi:MAG: 50S ribosomal protein L29 [Deltaproteobacteria bacterium]|nr:50S ribosomal protein L29 [Deltaproteobacteria bacterium]MBI4374805.1 50S ribosomal protein L29 [Deltaproteobacteria bacterium]